MQTIEFLLAIKSVEDQANVKNHNGSTALHLVEDCHNRDEKTMEIREFFVQAGVCPSTPPSKLHLFWNKYFTVGSDWLREVIKFHTHSLSLPLFLSHNLIQITPTDSFNPTLTTFSSNFRASGVIDSRRIQPVVPLIRAPS